MRKMSRWMLFAWLSGQPIAVMAFGVDGHRVTGVIAERLLSDSARAELGRILEGADLAALSLVADDQRAALAEQLPDSQRWHYDDRLVCHPDLPQSDYCPANACASAAIQRWRGVLADRAAPRGERARAVMFLVHILGDIHQPLHAADNNDRGGNAVRVLLPGDTRSRSLHEVWDVEFVRRAMQGRTAKVAAEAWFGEYRSSIAEWQRGRVEDWMAESYRLAVDVTYGRLPEWTCDRPPAAVQDLSGEYVALATELMPAQLTKAGARIATVLNAALAPAPPP